MNNENSILSDAALDEVAGGFNFGSFFGIPSMPSLPHAPTPKSLFASASNYVVSHSPVGAIGRALKFW
ncbi:MAG: hypothetical protein J0H42_12920 [Rhizobiales bacterium]|nr:hypothetical protein [Hyphomicrobiales bacterium]